MNKSKTKKIKTRGSAIFDPADNSFEYTPFNEGESSQKDVKSCAGGGKSWTTTGKDPSRMLSLKCKASSADPWSEYTCQLKKLGIKPMKPQQQPDCLRVVAEGGMQCWLDEAKSEVTFTGTIDLSRHSRDWQSEVLRQVQLVVRRLPGNERFNKVICNIKNGENRK